MKEHKRYTLLYKKYEIGMVTELSNEWPRPSGIIDINYSLKELNEETKQLFEYFDYSIKASDLSENHTEEEYCTYRDENEPLYLNLIHSNEWLMRDQSAVEHNIVIPVLEPNNEIFWTAFK